MDWRERRMLERIDAMLEDGEITEEEADEMYEHVEHLRWEAGESQWETRSGR